jgi:thioredoxin reductase (NADPH)
MRHTGTDVAVIGAGPIGLELAVALRRAGIDYIHFDARQIGYTISWFPPQTRFFSSNERIAIAGVPLQTPDQMKATREEYLAYLRGVVQQFDLAVNTYEPVVGIQGGNREFLITTQPVGRRRRYRARRVVLCTGGTDHPRRLNIPGEDLHHVSHSFQDPHKYFRKRLLVVGGKNSAVETALRCHHAGAEVSLSYRRAQLDPRSIKYWLLPEITSLIESGRIAAYFGTVPTEITPTHVRLAKADDGETEGGDAEKEPDPISASPGPRVSASSLPVSEVEFDFVLLQIGYEQDTKLLELAGIQLQGECRAPVFNERTMQTNVPGIYVAGTAVAGTQDKYRLFIENCHVHVGRIVAALTGAAPPAVVEQYARPET